MIYKPFLPDGNVRTVTETGSSENQTILFPQPLPSAFLIAGNERNTCPLENRDRNTGPPPSLVFAATGDFSHVTHPGCVRADDSLFSKPHSVCQSTRMVQGRRVLN
ncbi:hypothetical protein CEXT_283861 [Caerostris extrusa]|uniref:Uncharacterized protein n=1 Tax=Caerostris extrusa TaxID=172846 RepID=A0AAV4NMW6_CAEEX|nr:hypothetical protein CEXT_283861 [Caerostris extrusa]